MSTSLKSSTLWRAGLFLAVNVAVFVLLVLRRELTPDAVSSGAAEDWHAVPIGLALLVTTAMSGLASAEMKARIVFWRWRNALPGSEAFTRYAKSDPRVDSQALRHRHGQLPTDARAQNSLWYKLYREVEGDPAVRDAHRNYLLMRDVSVIALLLAPTLGSAAIVGGASPRRGATYVAALALQYLVARIAAANYGRRFVCTVLAVSSTKSGANSG